MNTRFARIFVYSAGGILLAAALNRFAIAAQSTQTLAQPEPILGIPLRFAVLITGAVELAAALYCLFGRRTGLQIGVLAWLATNFVAYRIGLRWEHVDPQCTGLGSVTDPLRLARGATGQFMAVMPYYFVFGSYASGLWLTFSKGARAARRTDADTAAGLLKMPCPGCGGRVKFEVKQLGQQIPCPHCQVVVTLRKPDLLKMSCYFCHEHVEFPSHAIGQKLKCPHCKMDITLKEPA